MTVTASRIQQTSVLTDRIASLKACRTPDSARNRVKKSEPIRMMKIDAVAITACDIASNSF